MKPIAALLVSAILALPLAGAQSIVVINNDTAGEGFNDPTVTVSPITGLASTLGADRLACFNAAADVWEAIIDLTIDVRIAAQFNSLGGTEMGFTPLGNAGPNTIFRDFAGAPIAATWYSVAQANQLFGGDLDPGDDIGATFNSDVDTGAVPGFDWYYGIDGAPPAGTLDFFSTVLHEIGHGLGFLSFVNVNTGVKQGGFNDIYSLQLEYLGTKYTSLSNAGRVVAHTSVSDLLWVGLNVVNDATFKPGGSSVRMYAPSTISPGSTLSHWDTVNSPNLLMEPFASDPFTNVTLETAAFQDMQWPLLTGPGVLSQSGGGIVLAGSTPELSATLINTSGTETFSWRLNGGSALADGPTGNGSTISGAATTTMTITNIQPADQGTYSLSYEDGGPVTQLTTFSLGVIPAGVPVANWIGLGLVGLMLLIGGLVALRRLTV